MPFLALVLSNKFMQEQHLQELLATSKVIQEQGGR